MHPAAGGAAAAAAAAAAPANAPAAVQRAFWQAITVGELETVQVLLDHRASEIDINMSDESGEQRHGCTALHLAILEMPTWKGTEGRNGIQTEKFVRQFFTVLLDAGADMDVCCRYSGEWYLQTAAGKTKAFYPDGYNSLGLVLQFMEITRGSEVISSNVTKRLELIRDILLKHIKTLYRRSAGIGSPPAALQTSFATLGQKLGEGLDGGAFSDFAICVGKDFCQPVHRFVLASRSSVFAAMLQDGNFAESASRQLVLDDADVDAVQHFIRFLYTDALELAVCTEPRLAHQLLVLANRFDVQGLLQTCSHALINHHLSPLTSSRLLSLADQNGATGLRERVLEFIADNIDVVKDTDDFKVLPTDLVQEVLNYVVDGYNSPARRLRKRARCDEDSSDITSSAAATAAGAAAAGGGEVRVPPNV